MWFLELRDGKGRPAGMIGGKSVELHDGTTFQAEWPDENVDNPKHFYHVRERFRSSDVRSIGIDEEDRVMVDFRRGKEPTSEPPTPLDEGTAQLDLAFSLATGQGFVEQLDFEGRVVKRLAEKRIITENLTQRTAGKFPQIRMRSEAHDVAGLVITGTSCIIVGRPDTGAPKG